jgi:hypothetical protein
VSDGGGSGAGTGTGGTIAPPSDLIYHIGNTMGAIAAPDQMVSHSHSPQSVAERIERVDRKIDGLLLDIRKGSLAGTPSVTRTLAPYTIAASSQA